MAISTQAIGTQTRDYDFLPAVDRSSATEFGEGDFLSDLQRWVSQGSRSEHRQVALKRFLEIWSSDGRVTDLDLSGLRLKSLPPCIVQLDQLRSINLADSDLSALPDFSRFPKLGDLILDAVHMPSIEQDLLPQQWVLSETPAADHERASQPQESAVASPRKPGVSQKKLIDQCAQEKFVSAAASTATGDVERSSGSRRDSKHATHGATPSVNGIQTQQTPDGASSVHRGARRLSIESMDSFVTCEEPDAVSQWLSNTASYRGQNIEAPRSDADRMQSDENSDSGSSADSASFVPARDGAYRGDPTTIDDAAIHAFYDVQCPPHSAISPPSRSGDFASQLLRWAGGGDDDENREVAQDRIMKVWNDPDRPAHLDLSGLQLKSLPDCLVELDQLQSLNLTNNDLERLPEWSRFARLATLYVSTGNLPMIEDYFQQVQWGIQQTAIRDVEQHEDLGAVDSTAPNSSFLPDGEPLPARRAESGRDDAAAWQGRSSPRGEDVELHVDATIQSESSPEFNDDQQWDQDHASDQTQPLRQANTVGPSATRDLAKPDQPVDKDLMPLATTGPGSRDEIAALDLPGNSSEKPLPKILADALSPSSSSQTAADLASHELPPKNPSLDVNTPASVSSTPPEQQSELARKPLFVNNERVAQTTGPRKLPEAVNLNPIPESDDASEYSVRTQPHGRQPFQLSNKELFRLARPGFGLRKNGALKNLDRADADVKLWAEGNIFDITQEYLRRGVMATWRSMGNHKKQPEVEVAPNIDPSHVRDNPERAAVAIELTERRYDFDATSTEKIIGEVARHRLEQRYDDGLPSDQAHKLDRTRQAWITIAGRDNVINELQSRMAALGLDNAEIARLEKILESLRQNMARELMVPAPPFYVATPADIACLLSVQSTIEKALQPNALPGQTMPVSDRAARAEIAPAIALYRAFGVPGMMIDTDGDHVTTPTVHTLVPNNAMQTLKDDMANFDQSRQPGPISNHELNLLVERFAVYPILLFKGGQCNAYFPGT